MQTKQGNKNYVIVTSDEPWSEIWHTQLHYANQLSRRYEVIFVNPPVAWSFSNLFNHKSETFSVTEHLTVTRYHNLLPSKLGKLALWLNDKFNERLLNKMMRSASGYSLFLFWHFDPFRSFFSFGSDKKVKHLYHVIDPIAGHHLDVEFSKKADLVVITSPRFEKHYKALNKNVVQIGQGVDCDFYDEMELTNASQKLISENTILLLGTISNDVDFILLGKLAKRFKQGLVLIGPDKITRADRRELFLELLKIEGVHWLGAMKPEEFRKHVKACRIGIIAYDSSVNFKNNMRSPLKVISYLACGKAIISNIECEIPSLMEKGIYLVDKEASYFELIEKSYADTLIFDKEAVGKYLQSIDYNQLLEKIFMNLNLPLENKR